MSKNTVDDIYRKISKWTDDIKKDTKYYGVGTVQNQTQLINGATINRLNEDRSFSYEFKENAIYAFGLLDGYNGTWAVDLVDQSILTNTYFDHLDTLQKKNDDEVFEILTNEFQKTEELLRDNSYDILLKIADINVQLDMIKKGTPEYQERQREIKYHNAQINSGVFALVSLVIDNRLFVANVGPINCFVCLVDKEDKYKLKVVPLQTDHSLANIDEVMRLIKIKADITDLDQNHLAIKYTRCLGDFKIKSQYQEHDVLRSCTEVPILAKPDHPIKSILIDDSYLFVGIYSDAVGKAILEIDPRIDNVNIKITDMLINKIISEQTLNSAAQSVLDEVKRSYDDKFISKYSERDDLTLVVRSFDSNIKNRLLTFQNQVKNEIETTQINSTINSTIESTINSYDDETDEQENTIDKQAEYIKSLLDENDKVKNYIDFDQINEVIKEDLEFEQFVDELLGLVNGTNIECEAN